MPPNLLACSVGCIKIQDMLDNVNYLNSDSKISILRVKIRNWYPFKDADSRSQYSELVSVLRSDSSEPRSGSGYLVPRSEFGYPVQRSGYSSQDPDPSTRLEDPDTMFADSDHDTRSQDSDPRTLFQDLYPDPGTWFRDPNQGTRF